MNKLIAIPTAAVISLSIAGTALSSAAGRFCKVADIGKQLTASNGRTIVCTAEGSRARWRYTAAGTPAPPQPTPAPAPTPTPAQPGVDQPVTTPAQPTSPAKPAKGKRTAIFITKVIDGDTVKAKRTKNGRPYGKAFNIRVVGIDTPETRKPRVKVECGGKEATKSAKRMVRRYRGHAVLVSDPTQASKDKYGRGLGYVMLGKKGVRDFGRTLVAQGWAMPYVYKNKPFVRYSEYVEAADSAWMMDRGVYGKCGGDFHSRQPGGEWPPNDLGDE